MDNTGDFIQHLGLDMSTKILSILDDPSDLVRLCLVSSPWHQFVMENSLCKELCLRLYPELSGAVPIIEKMKLIEPSPVRLGKHMELEALDKIHRVYAMLTKGLNPFTRKDCISEPISASSTDNYPQESIDNTLEPGYRVMHRASYWSSKGESDPNVPEALVYKLVSKLCVVSEIHVQPFKAYFQYGCPIYSSKAVRFRMGHPKLELQSDIAAFSALAEDNFVWTYTSPVFPMAQENTLQKFKLPEPVLCIGGILRVELLGRVQKQEMDGLYYICIAHVQVVGRPLMQTFDVDMFPSGKCILKYNSKAAGPMSPGSSSDGETSASSRLRAFTARLMQIQNWEQMIFTRLPGTGVIVGDDNDEEELDEELDEA